ncbi:MAG: hypothetical protein ACKOQ4_01150 [Mycobacterium sp.]
MSSADSAGITSRVVAGIGGLLLGHILWLILISMAVGSSAVSTWVLVVSVLVAAGATLAWRRARACHRRNELVSAVFLAALPVAPVVFSVIVLGETYL